MTRAAVADFLNTLIQLYSVLILIRIVMSYFTRIPYNRVLEAVTGFVRDVTDPYLNVFRRVIPPVRLGPAALDLSPIVALFVLRIVGSIMVGIVRG